MNTTKLKILTPKGIFYQEEITIVTLKTIEGYIGLQYGISPFVSSLVPSKIFIKRNNQEEEFYISSGLVYAEKEYINIISDAISKDESVLNIKLDFEDTNNHKSYEDMQMEIKLKRELTKK